MATLLREVAMSNLFCIPSEKLSALQSSHKDFKNRSLGQKSCKKYESHWKKWESHPEKWESHKFTHFTQSGSIFNNVLKCPGITRSTDLDLMYPVSV